MIRGVVSRAAKETKSEEDSDLAKVRRVSANCCPELWFLGCPFLWTAMPFFGQWTILLCSHGFLPFLLPTQRVYLIPGTEASSKVD